MAGRLNGRVRRLEADAEAPGRPLPGLRAAPRLRPDDDSGPAGHHPGGRRDGHAGGPATPLCLCDPCCGDPRDRWLARLSHGLDAA